MVHRICQNEWSFIYIILLLEQNLNQITWARQTSSSLAFSLLYLAPNIWTEMLRNSFCSCIKMAQLWQHARSHMWADQLEAHPCIFRPCTQCSPQPGVTPELVNGSVGSGTLWGATCKCKCVKQIFILILGIFKVNEYVLNTISQEINRNSKLLNKNQSILPNQKIIFN